MGTDLKQVKDSLKRRIGVINFTRPVTTTVYDNREGKSTTMAVAMVPILAAGISVKVTVYARMANGEIKPDPTLPGKGVIGEDSPGTFDEIRDAVAEQIVQWGGYEAAYDGAANALAGVKSERKVIPARLVKDGKLVPLPALAV